MESYSPEHIRRYSRQIICTDLIGRTGQIAIQKARVLIIGCGGLGSIVIMYLAGAGVGQIDLMDHDVCEVQNLHRQIIHSELSVGQNKAHSAESSIRRLNSSIKTNTITTRMHQRFQIDFLCNLLCFVQNLNKIHHLQDNTDLDFGAYNVIADCTDNPEAHCAISKIGQKHEIPVVWASVVTSRGQMTVLHPSGPCYRCIVPENPRDEYRVKGSTHGIFGPSAGLMGCMQATEVMKLITHPYDLDRLLIGRLLLVDCACYSLRVIQVSKQANCPVCGNGQTEHLEISVSVLNNVKGIRPTELKQMLPADDMIIVDIRPQEHFEIAHIEKSINCPFEDMSQIRNWHNELTKIVEIKNRIVIVSINDHDSQTLVSKLQELNLLSKSKVFYLIGGLCKWKHVHRSFPLY
ncbi:hypothetical protein ACOME3_007764 [Neoechinorhynchus agilis]